MTLGADVSFQEIEAIIDGFAPLDDDAAGQAMVRQLDLGATIGGDAALASWIASCQGRYPIRLDRPHLAVFAAAHGIDPDATAAVVAAMEATGRGEGGLYGWSEEIDADLRLYEMALSDPSASLAAPPALSEARIAAAVAYGMMAVDDGTDVLGVAALSLAADIPAAAVGRALCGGDALAWGTKFGDPATSAETPLRLLATWGGEDIAAAVGAIIAGRVAGVPVLLDGLAAWAAGAVVSALREDGIDHCALLVPDMGSRTPAHDAFDHHLPAARLDAVPGVMPGESAARAIASLREATVVHTAHAT
jgi:nicotinate-nucleotide--dimethylbenzimidazole phosphoribosyltransferase